jgi:N-acetylmuramoyl-L-alanine amidase
VRSGPGQSYAIVTQVRENGVFTIIEERSGYGKLKSGAGWIDLSYTKRV